MKNANELKEWQALKTHQKTIAGCHMQTWFDADPARFSKFSLSVGEILLDYSKNRITSETLNLLNRFATAAGLKQKIENMFSGKLLNNTEGRAALHTALRSKQSCLLINEQNIMLGIQETLDKMRVFSEQIRNKTWRGITGKPIRDIVNIGIGGSHLGPLMAIHGLLEFANKDLRCHFISNIDSAHIYEVLENINPETTLFIISSKSFTTLETMTNAAMLRQWVQSALGDAAISAHFVAITADIGKAIAFGISKNNIFRLWDWVGGRFSIWSAIGLPLAIMIGMDNFLQFLDGAFEMDQHFRYADFSENLPVIMGLIGIWYINFFDTTHHAIVPYSHHLHFFRVHLQQVDMESNGKNISERGDALDFLTCPIIFGEQGCNGQHAFHQLLHQGPHLVPVDFILVGKEKNALPIHRDILIGSGLSQAQALMRGRSYTEALAELHEEGLTTAESELLAKHKTIPGNRPSNTLFIHKITPHNLGALLALYEHKTFVQGALWQINSFDQWGVELGKKLLPRILTDLNSVQPNRLNSHDSSTEGLIQHYKNVKELT